ncbi:MAG TPA: CDP-diacylglycerol--glycerol-3-phosphate 3-phosphatidyltransferase [Candidatus Acidoferrales bacterium]|nr:CDP-diacylglycerol--glycerol-3-phosphate 3-phosphatidyltransferase [Candidatus Acidoferrales bacterium]
MSFPTTRATVTDSSKAAPGVQAAPRASIWNLPNCLSLMRIIMIPLIVYLLVDPKPFSSALAAALFFAASLTDFFDGYLARRHQTVSDLGKILDPLADKLMIVSVLIMLAATDRPGEPGIPAWLVVLIVARETAVTIIRGIALTEGIVMAAEELGKYKFLLQSAAVFSLLVHYTYLGVNFYAIGMYFLWLAAILSVWSGIIYHFKFFRLYRQKQRPA